MATEIYSTDFKPESGKIVELPSNIKRITTDRLGSPQLGYGTLHIGVGGIGEITEYVILAVDEGEIELESGSQFLAVDCATEKAFYAVPRSEY
ncbi:hypothetical protein [Natrinema versiforme]|uniref:Uncharacterized protein n=1 Tax=Natrinema versiforme TaxID=88724 RepID=A0A4P8WIG0_9EURY|nr:hypothetical protein [Natrinema versiforme]QCS43014.1 hypothetical protein FEJ81_11835 [Natrinema versiforme]